MRDAVYQYLNTFEPFDMFGVEHIVAIIAALVIIIFLPLFAKRHLDEKHSINWVCSLAGWSFQII